MEILALMYVGALIAAVVWLGYYFVDCISCSRRSNVSKYLTQMYEDAINRHLKGD